MSVPTSSAAVLSIAAITGFIASDSAASAGTAVPTASTAFSLPALCGQQRAKAGRAARSTRRSACAYGYRILRAGGNRHLGISHVAAAAASDSATASSLSLWQ